jgi:hypothetical protein
LAKVLEALIHFEKAAELGEPQGMHYASLLRQMQRVESEEDTNPIQQAFEAFQQTGSPAEIRQVVARFPFMTNPQFMASVEQVAQQAPLEQKPAFEERLATLREIASEQRLSWLRQIANEQQ